MDFFGSRDSQKYNAVPPDSDSDDDNEGGDFIKQHVRNQQVNAFMCMMLIHSA